AVIARGYPRDLRVEGIKQRRFTFALRLLDAHLERRPHHEALQLRFHHPVRPARARQAELVATTCAHPPPSSFTSIAKRLMNIRFPELSCRGIFTPDYTKFIHLAQFPICPCW